MIQEGCDAGIDGQMWSGGVTTCSDVQAELVQILHHNSMYSKIGQKDIVRLAMGSHFVWQRKRFDLSGGSAAISVLVCKLASQQSSSDGGRDQQSPNDLAMKPIVNRQSGTESVQT